MSQRPQALFAMTAENVPQVFPPEVLARLRASVDIDPALVARDFADPGVREALARTEILVTGWGCPRLDEAVLDAAPRLRAVLHSAGSVKSFATPGIWRRGIAVSSAAAANALPVAEYTLAMILLAGKDVLVARDRMRATRTSSGWGVVPGIGNYGRRVGVVGASRIGRRVLELLRPFASPANEDGVLGLYLDGKRISDVGVPPMPEYYRHTLASGKSVMEVAPTIQWGYLIYPTVFRVCQYFGAKEECQYCDDQPQLRASTRPPGARTPG
ncbi:hypothetical protein SVIOM74S_06120 [Streptomyces violarus]